MRRKQKWKAIRNNILLLFGTLLVFFLVLEIVLRLLHTTPPTDIFAEPTMLQRSNNSILIYEMRPNFLVKKPGDYFLFTNMHGFRDYNYTYEKPPNTYRIVLLGDSVPFGIHFPLEKTYPKLLEKGLNERDQSRHYEVISLATGGYSTRQEVELLKEKGLQYNPDLVLVSYVLNDPITSSGPSNYFQRYKPTEGTETATEETEKKKSCLIYTFNITIPCSIYRSLHRSAVVLYFFPKIRNAYYIIGEDVYHRIHYEHWNNVVEAFDLLANETQSRNIDVLVAIFPLFREFDDYPWEDIHAKVADLAKEKNLNTINLYPRFKKYPEDRLRETPEDLIHLSEEGHKITAEILAENILRRMNATQRTRRNS